MFIVLVFLNGLFFLWNWLYHVDEAAKISLIDEEIPSLNVLESLRAPNYSASSNSFGHSSCFTAGPYYSEKAAQLVAGEIRRFGLVVTIRSINSKETLNYLIYIPQQVSKVVAQKIVSDLLENKVENPRIVENGPYKNAITFGFYRNFEQLKRSTEYIRYLGYDAKYTEQKVKRKVYWVDYDEPLGTGAPVLLWSKAIDPNVVVQIIPRKCTA
jgi:hypothetical protein